jgi:hypothetical protein
MGTSKEADKLLYRIRDIFVECLVLASEDGFDHLEIQSMGFKLTKLATKMETQFPMGTRAVSTF